MDLNFKDFEVWFVTGSQDLYGEETLRQVEADAKEVARSLNERSEIPVTVVFKPVMTSADAIRRLILEANVDERCIGLITWMHTFSPARMWIAGLNSLRKPYLHFHTQYNRDIPWDSIDMDYMNLHQSAHGDREYGFINTRMRKNRKVVVGHWQDAEVLKAIGAWTRVAAAWHDGQGAKIARFGDNMRHVAVTEGDKVAAQIQFGYEVNGYSLSDLTAYVDQVTDAQINALLEEYDASYELSERVRPGGEFRDFLKESARIEAGMRAFLKDGGFKGFTTNFEDLTGLKQLPGLASQRLMKDGYGFGAEGDWKTAALTRLLKIMAHNDRTVFMEDYTLDLRKGHEAILGAHMLEVDPTIASDQPRVEVHPLDIGGKDDPARLVFTGADGEGIDCTVADFRDGFRLISYPVTCRRAEAETPHLPVAKQLWTPKVGLKEGATAWIQAGGGHHTVLSFRLKESQIHDLGVMLGMELVEIC